MSSKLPKPKYVSLKYSLRLWAVPKLARILNLFGKQWSDIGKSLGRETTISQNMSLQNSHGWSNDNSKEGSQHIIMLSMISGHTFTINHEILLASALRLRGHRVTFVICDQKLSICETKKYGKEDRWKELCGKCYAFGKKLLESTGFHVIPISALAQNHVEVDTGMFTHIKEATLLKHYQVGELDEETNDRHRREALIEDTVRTTAKVGKSIVDLKPDTVIMSHGIYATWGPQREILCDAGIPVVTYSETKKKQTLKFNWGFSADWWDIQDAWDQDKDTELSEAQESQIDAYMQSRINHTQDIMIYNFGNYQSKEETLERLNLDPNKLTYALFTNVLWDAASTHREIVFEDPIEWVEETVKWFAEHPEKQLILKVHPAEVVIGTNQSFLDIIHKRISTIPPNIRIIPPDEKINSWSICAITDLGIVHTTTVGMELPLLGIPTVVVSKTHFREKGFTVDLNSKEEYFKYLNEFDPKSVNSDLLVKLAKRYSYMLYERYQLPFDFAFSHGHYSNVCAYKLDQLEDLAKDSNVQFIIDCIEKRKPFVLPN